MGGRVFFTRVGDDFRGRKSTAVYLYEDAAGKSVLAVGRFDGKERGDKTYLTYSYQHGRWWPTLSQVLPSGEILGGLVERLLYRRLALEGAETVFVVEGEKAAEAGRTIEPLLPAGTVFTTSV